MSDLRAGSTGLIRGWFAGCCVAIAGLGSAAQGAAQVPAAPAGVKVAGVSFDRTTRLDGQELRLNGVGVRAVAWFKGYAAALYLAQPTSSPGQAMTASGPKRLQMRMLVDVPADEFVKAFHKGVQRNTAPEMQSALTERMLQFDRVMRSLGKVRSGDVVNLDFVPAQGLQLMLNGAARGPVIPGADLYAALLGIFLGEHPVDDKLKAGLLGAKPR